MAKSSFGYFFFFKKKVVNGSGHVTSLLNRASLGFKTIHV